MSAHRLKVESSSVVRKSRKWEQEVKGRVALQSGSRGVNAGAKLCVSFSSCPGPQPVTWCVYSGVPTSIHLT